MCLEKLHANAGLNAVSVKRIKKANGSGNDRICVCPFSLIFLCVVACTKANVTLKSRLKHEPLVPPQESVLIWDSNCNEFSEETHFPDSLL